MTAQATPADTAPQRPRVLAQTQQVGRRAVSTWKHSIKAQQEITAITRTKLELTCHRAASGNPSTLEQVAREACVDIVSVAPVPVPKEQALPHCNKVS